ncbi:MAG TPA: STAS domain-containing protein [Bacillota bacterium]
MSDSNRAWSDEESAGLKVLAGVLRDNMASLLEVMSHAAAAGADEPVSRQDLERGLRDTTERLEHAARTGDLTSFLEAYQARVREQALAGRDYDEAMRTMVAALDHVVELILGTQSQDPDMAAKALRAQARLRTEMLIAAGRAYVRVREAAVEEEHLKVIRDLSTPVIQVWEDVLVLPLIGVIDSARARQIMEQLLERIVERQARIVLLDITGVATVDTQVANHLIKTTQAARLVGAHSILVGMSPQVAQALVRLGLSFGNLETYLDLRSGLERAFALLGYSVVKTHG